MTILCGDSIRALEIVSPCQERMYCNGMTHGLGPAGYDLTVEFDAEGVRDCIKLWPGDFRLVSARERLMMPKNVVGIVHDKSTWARRGLAVQNTVVEPGWRGYLTLELSNHGNAPLTLWKGDPIAQVVFHLLDNDTEGYSGRYQNQGRGPQSPR